MTALKTRNTVRAVLFDPNDRVLLSKVYDLSVTDPNAPIRGDFWCTIGGKMEPGEDLLTALAREIREEIGQGPSSLSIVGPVWYGEQELKWGTAPTLMRETFVLVRTNSTDLNREGQTPEELAVMKELRWWPLAELRTTSELIVPPIMKMLLAELALGKVPEHVLDIDLSISGELRDPVPLALRSEFIRQSGRPSDLPR